MRPMTSTVQNLMDKFSCDTQKAYAGNGLKLKGFFFCDLLILILVEIAQQAR